MSDKHTPPILNQVPEELQKQRQSNQSASAKQQPPPSDAQTPPQSTSQSHSQTEFQPNPENPDQPHQEEALKAKCDEYLAGWQRARADYQNLQKETERRITEIIQYSNEEFIRELLPTIDHFNYAFKGIPPEERSKAWIKGIEHIQTNMFKTLESHGVQRIPTVGQPFNPELHESVEEVSAEGEISGASGTVIEEVSAGFTLNGKVIQHAKVKVIK